MKRVHFLSALTLLLSLFYHVASGQAPQSFKYQSVARNSSGEPIANSDIGLRISIRDQSATGTIAYRETHTAVTNGFGLFSISIGEGTSVSGTFSSINWSSGSKFLEVEADFSGGTNYTSMGTSQLLSVPYALYAASGTPGPQGPVGPQGPIGIQGLTGSNGTNGSNGLNILNGATDPTAGTGVSGEFYINTTTNTLFGPKAGGAWPSGISLIGPAGASGSNGMNGVNGSNGLNLLNGTTNPTAGVGVNGEFYINTTTLTLFGPKASGAWPAGVSLIGPTGNTGATGLSGANGINGLNILNGTTNPTAGVGVNGEFYINTTTSTLFGPKAAGAWPSGVSLIGSAGTNGTNGANGINGLNILNGTANPTAGVGVNGEFYINTVSSTLFGPKAGGVWPGGVSLIGPSGPSTNAWGLTGNSGTSEATNFIGTTDMKPLILKVNSQNAGRIDPTGPVFLGTEAGLMNTAPQSTGIGTGALLWNTTGGQNTAVGYISLGANTTGAQNTATGTASLGDNTTGDHNTAFGNFALGKNITGNQNTAVGMQSLLFNTVGSFNTAVGRYAMFSNVSGGSNTAIGNGTLYASLGNFNTAIGAQALSSNSTGNNNTANGLNALSSNTTGSNNSALGFNAFLSGTNYSNSTAVGYNAQVTASNMIRLGDANVTSINGAVAFTVVSDGRFKKDIKEDVSGLSFIMKLRPVTYHLDMESMARFMKTPDNLRSQESEMAKEKVLQTGLIAQEVEKAAKEIGYDFSGVDKPNSEQGYYGLRYAEFTVPLIKAVQEQQAIIENQKQELKRLAEENIKLKESLEARLKKLEEVLVQREQP